MGLGCFIVVSFIVSVLKMDALIFVLRVKQELFFIVNRKGHFSVHKNIMSVHAYLQTALEACLEKKIESLENETTLSGCLTSAVKQVCEHHNLHSKDSSIDLFIKNVSENENEGTIPFSWDECEGFKDLVNHMKSDPNVNTTVNAKQCTESKCASLVDIDFVRCPGVYTSGVYKNTSTDEKNKKKVIGILVTMDSQQNQAHISLVLQLQQENSSSIVLETQESGLKLDANTLYYAASVPNSKSNLVLIANGKGVCSLLQIVQVAGNAQLVKLPLEFMLDVPENSKLNFLRCRRSDADSDLILFWGGGQGSKVWNFYTGINESCLKQSQKKMNRLFRAVNEEDLDFITYTRPSLKINYDKDDNVTSVKDESDRILFAQPGYVHFYADCMSDTHDVLVLQDCFRYATACPVPESCEECSLTWYFKKCTGKFFVEAAAAENKNKQIIVSISLF